MSKHRILSTAVLLLLIVSLFSGGFPSKVDALPVTLPASPVDETVVPHYFGPYPNWGLSPLTMPDATVTINGDGTGATATATVGAGGAITAINITNPGKDYTAATVTITGVGTGAMATATVTSTNTVVAINVTAAGLNYLQPSVAITGGGATTNATATAYGGVDSVSLTHGGSGYTLPVLDFDFPDGEGGVQAQGHVTWDETTGVITGVVIDNPGSGYSKAPNVVIRDGPAFSPLNRRQYNAGLEAKEQGILNPQEGQLQGTILVLDDAIVTSTINVQTVVVETYGAGYTSLPTVDITDTVGTGTGATAEAVIDTGAVTAITIDTPGTGYVTGTGIKKFENELPLMCDPSVAGSCDAASNNLGQYIPLGVPDITTFDGADYYVIALVQHREQLNSSLPAQGTLLREYVQLETPDNASWSKHIPLVNHLLDGTTTPALMPDGSQAYGVDDPHYLGPIIQASKDRPVRLVFYNLLPTGVDGDLFLPVDTTFMGAGMGPGEMGMPPMDEGSVLDGIRNPACGEADRDMMTRMECFADTRATLHLHGGITPWISDGTPHQWITPANEHTNWPEGVAVRQVPDMVGLERPDGVPDCTAPDDGCMTFYYTNQQSARFMFFHDHSWGITRLNVYAGEAAGYVIRDETETALINAGLIPSGQYEIPLVVQDKTFVSSPEQMAELDPTWDYSRWGAEGDLWYEHVYMPAENPADPGGMSSYGRWFYGPWFWPPADPVYPPIANPYFGLDPEGANGIRGDADDWGIPLASPCNLDDPATWQYDTDPFCEPPFIPGTPNNSAGMEEFNDTPLVNGTAYPTLTVDPTSYRFRILNAANDRFWNLQWYVADPTQVDPTAGLTEVALNPLEVAAAQLDPNVFPTPDLTLSPAGPDWIQIGSESGFLPQPAIVPAQHTTWITDPTRFDVGLVDQHSLLMGPAERADVVVDFSAYAGQTLILYNDAPAAFPARISTYDYYTGMPDMYPNAPAMVMAGYGPNTRTIMQVKVAPNPPAPTFNFNALRSAFLHKADGSGVFESGQNPIIVGQAAYNPSYGTNFAASGWCNGPIDPSPYCDGFARISDQGGDIFNFDTLLNNQLGVKIEPKAIQDEMNESIFEPFGRMQGNIGVEIVPATPGTQNTVLYPFVNPPTEMFDGTNLPTTANLTPIATGDDGTQIWKFTHNGVDSHPMHFHLFDVQLLNRVTWDNIIKPPEGNELGWKDTVRVHPLEDTYFALRPIIPIFPFEIPNSIRPLDPMMPLGNTTMFNPTDADGIPTDPIVNSLVNFGWEYMLHCHILSHEEMDMMRPITVAMPPIAPDGLLHTIIGNSLTLVWQDNSITETEFDIEATSDGFIWETVGTISSPLDQPNTHGARSFTDTSFNGTRIAYRVVAKNTIGYLHTTAPALNFTYTTDFPSVTAKSMSAPYYLAGAWIQLFMPQVYK
jgi:FtsP/CotA-like multicopper oxidase with cupredoxin domain